MATNFAYASGSNRLMSTSGGMTATYGYNANGNTTTVNSLSTYTYDVFNRLANASGAGFLISAEDQRLRKTFGGNTTYFIPDTGGTLLAEQANGSWKDYVWLNGRPVAMITGGSVYAVHADQTGRAMAVTAPNKSVTWASKNDPFDRSTTTGSAAFFALGFPGQYRDAEDGLWHNGFRDYDARAGRYIQSDPIGLAGGVNTYAYVGGNPISNIDQLGLKTCPLKPGQAPDASHEALEPVHPELYIFGIGRLLYAGAAATIPSIATATTETHLGAAIAAVRARNSLKIIFRLGFFPNFRIYPTSTVLTRYSGNAVETVAAAGRTNKAFNTAAVVATTAAARGNQTAFDGNCGCP